MCWKVRCAISLIGLSLIVSGQAQSVSGLGKWFDKEISSRLTWSGYRRLSYHNRTVTGDKDAYDLIEYGGRGLSEFTDFGQVHVTGNKVLGILNFDINVQDSRFQDPQANRVSVDIERGPWTANLGDIRGSLASTNRFARFEKSLSGGQFGYKSKKFQARAIYSDVRGQARTVSLQGNNTAGPYFLQSSQIVRGSEQVLVDGVVQKFGEDYTMDYDLGSILFVNKFTYEGRIIPPTSSIVATYEVLGFNGSKGRVEGVSTGFDLGRAGRVGLTAMRQVQGGTVRDSTIQQQFLGLIRAGDPVFLQYEPVNVLTVVVRIGATVLTYGTDFYFKTNISVLYLRIDVPTDAVLTVEYVPRAVNTVQGDRDVIGLDYRYSLGDKGAIIYSQSTGRLTNTSTPKSGTARGLDLTYKTGKAEFTGSLRDIPSGYVSIENASFERNERASQLGVRVQPSDRFEYGFSHQNSSIKTLDSNNKSIASRYSQAEGYVDFKPKNSGLPWKLTQNHSASRGPNGNTSVDTTSLGTLGQRGRADWKLDLQNQFASGLTTIDNVQARRKLNIQTLEYRLNYRAADSWMFNLNTSVSRVGTSGQSSIGRDILFGATYRPNEKLSVRASVADSDAGKLATLGFLSGSGFGYGGNGFSSGADDSGFNGATNARNANLSVTWEANDRLSFNGNLVYYRSMGGVSSNTETKGFGVGANWTVNSTTNVDAMFDASTTNFVDSPLQSNASTLSLYATSNPKGRLSFRGGINVLLTSGNSLYSQNSFGYEANLAYALAHRHSLVFSMDNGSLTGYLPQETRNVALTYQYQIWRSLAFNVGYRMIDVVNRDSNSVGGEYRSRGFDVELLFNFGR